MSAWNGVLELNNNHLFRFWHKRRPPVFSYWFIPKVKSVQFSHSVMSNSLQPHGLQHARLPCPSLSPRVCSNSRPLSWWCHPTTSSSVVPFSAFSQSSQHQGLFHHQIFTSGGQSIGASPCNKNINTTRVVSSFLGNWFKNFWLFLLKKRSNRKALLGSRKNPMTRE